MYKYEPQSSQLELTSSISTTVWLCCDVSLDRSISKQPSLSLKAYFLCSASILNLQGLSARSSLLEPQSDTSTVQLGLELS